MTKPKGMRFKEYESDRERERTRTHHTIGDRLIALGTVLMSGVVGFGVADVLNTGYELLFAVISIVIVGVLLKDYFTG